MFLIIATIPFKCFSKYNTDVSIIELAVFNSKVAIYLDKFLKETNYFKTNRNL